MGIFDSNRGSDSDHSAQSLENNHNAPALYLLFDLNKTLTKHVYVPGSVGVNTIRPGVEQLHRLLPHFHLGIYSSSSPKTVDDVIRAIQEKAGNSEFGRLFDDPDMVLHRSHTLPASSSQQTRSGKSWDTVKPIQPYFPDRRSVLLIDDEPSKVLTEEISNLITVPPWHGDDDDCVLTNLVDAILTIVPTVNFCKVDLRDYSSRITNALWKTL